MNRGKGLAVEGEFLPDLLPLAQTFGDMVAAGEERGAIAVMRGDRVLLHLWGGLADPLTGRRWSAGTRACCFSVSKGVLSILAHILMTRGLFGPDQPVCSLWPEFAAEGKADITIADVLTHRAGLPAVSGQVRQGDLYDWSRMVELLAASRPVVPHRAVPVYHNMTYGHLLGEILLRATGAASISALVRQEFGTEFVLGMTTAEAETAARLGSEGDPDMMAVLDRPPQTVFDHSMQFFHRDEDFNTARWRTAAIGSGSGHATALGLARIFAELVHDGSLSPGRRAAASTEAARSEGVDPVMGIPMRFSQGLELSGPPWLDFGPDPGIIGHWGAGGATALADPRSGLSFGYVTGHMAPGFGSSQRGRRLVAALFESNV